MVQLEGLCGDARQIVRMDFVQETWPEFGFRKGECAVGKAAKTAPRRTRSVKRKNRFRRSFASAFLKKVYSFIISPTAANIGVVLELSA